MPRIAGISKRRSNTAKERPIGADGQPDLRDRPRVRYGLAMLNRRRRNSVLREPIVDILPRICGGRPHLRGTRVQVAEIALWHERLGLTTDQIVARNPQLTLAAVEAALAYYAEHRHQIPLHLHRANKLLDNEHVAALPSAGPAME